MQGGKNKQKGAEAPFNSVVIQRLTRLVFGTKGHVHQ